MNAPMVHTPVIREADLADRGEAEAIEAFVAANEGDVFHRPLWLQAIAHGTGNSARGLIAERGGRLAGWLPLSDVHSPLFGRALVSSGFGVGGGVLAARDDDARRLCRAAEELAGRLCAASVELRGGSAPADWTTISGKHANFAAELAADDEAQLLAIPRKARAEVRKGLKHDLTVTTGTAETDRAAHYAVYAQSVRNLGTPVFPRTLFDAVLDRFGDDADILTVRQGELPVASVL
tara:strand:- start:47 stop:754 length:708 start_codon:yes stop_codon:yes gene_type:complete